LYMGPKEAARAFGYPSAYKRDDADKEKDKGGTEDTSSSANKSAAEKGLDKRKDWQFINTLDKDGDERVSEKEFTDWATAYARTLVSNYEEMKKLAEEEALILAQGAKGNQNRLSQIRNRQNQLRTQNNNSFTATLPKPAGK